MPIAFMRQSWRRHTAPLALAAAFLGVVALGRGLSAPSVKADLSLAHSLPRLAHEVGVTPIVTLCGKETIVRVGSCNGKRVYSVFDRGGAPLAVKLSRKDFAKQFPRIHLEEMRDVTSGFAPDATLLADTPDHPGE